MTDAILARDAPEGAAAILNAMLWSCTNKLTSMVTVQSALLARIEQKNEGEEPLDVTFIEKSRPIGSAAFATENPEDLLKGKLSHVMKGGLLTVSVHRLQILIQGYFTWSAYVLDRFAKM